MSVQCEHAFKTTITASKFEAVFAKACRTAFTIDMIAHDPTLIPHIRIFNVTFTSLEDRDRARIAMRFLEKEMAEAEAASRAAPANTLARRLASV